MLTHHPILFEDDSILLINKPAGVLSHPNASQNALSHCAFLGKYNFEERRYQTSDGSIWLIHRLDQDTSGVLLAAKSIEIAEICRDYFEKQAITKIYLAMVKGKFSHLTGFWSDYLQKHAGDGKVRSKVIPHRLPNAKLKYKVLRFPSSYGPRSVSEEKCGGRGSVRAFKNGGIASVRAAVGFQKSLSLLEVELLTGKTHQIRVQAANRGHPIAGDRIYGDFQWNRQLRDQLGLKRLFLHAWKLGFLHPKTGKSLEIDAPVPEDLSSIVDCGLRIN